MAVDGALLARAQQPTLRLYGWQPHAVSLGHFQSYADFADLPEGTSIVRRSTGGGAIHHGDELTYSLALDLDLLPRDLAAGYALVHDALVRALAQIGVACHRAADGRMSARPQDRWCFAHPVQGDLMTDRGKLCGSAQRREKARVLHHGSLVLRRPGHTPFVAAVEDQVEPTEDVRSDLRAAVIGEVAKALTLEPATAELDQHERAMATQLREHVFSTPEHVQKR